MLYKDKVVTCYTRTRLLHVIQGQGCYMLLQLPVVCHNYVTIMSQLCHNFESWKEAIKILTQSIDGYFFDKYDNVVYREIW